LKTNENNSFICEFEIYLKIMEKCEIIKNMMLLEKQGIDYEI